MDPTRTIDILSKSLKYFLEDARLPMQRKESSLPFHTCKESMPMNLFRNSSTGVHQPVWGTWTDFKVSLQNRFQNKTFKQETWEALEHFYKDKLSVDDYFTKLNMMFADTGLATTTDAEKIRILKKSIDPKIVDTIWCPWYLQCLQSKSHEAWKDERGTLSNSDSRRHPLPLHRWLIGLNLFSICIFILPLTRKCPPASLTVVQDNQWTSAALVNRPDVLIVEN
jgi:hypothetical protein